MKKIVILSMLVGLLSGCTMKKTGGMSTIVLTGEITPLGMTTFQYGTHKINSENKTYALQSSRVKLDEFVNKSVTLKGKKVLGYPIESGPELIEVSEISFK
ncbi:MULTISPECIES: hypothetical protein [Sphingobacterium]|jgi:hypothetical protein|uniref:hypothetical protein n=1 Tax=Sphingobacterium TaxID=28453 RepID=UPI00038A3235|nr:MULTISPECIES: hypothetical protein [unclassified Sphingobacterium]KKX48297.1 hypothetical protein L950_0221845 [Sphingobacterium sp. IITKGP-BTPF85]NJI74173.1 hypothetical protein [Sphingobacterium sp. B16(2022)]